MAGPATRRFGVFHLSALFSLISNSNKRHSRASILGIHDAGTGRRRVNTHQTRSLGLLRLPLPIRASFGTDGPARTPSMPMRGVLSCIAHYSLTFLMCLFPYVVFVRVPSCRRAGASEASVRAWVLLRPSYFLAQSHSRLLCLAHQVSHLL